MDHSKQRSRGYSFAGTASCCRLSRRLSGKVCIITGTGGGMGRAAALAFARGGGAGVGCGLNVESAEATVWMGWGGGGRREAGEPWGVAKPADCWGAVGFAAP